jgi:hypothetical protein
MATRTSYGFCEACGSRTSKAAMTAHLRKCLSKEAGKASSEVLLFRVQALGAPMFWLDCAAASGTKLKDLDTLLRGIWVECCGHLSEFHGQGRRKVSMSTTLGQALGGAKRLDYKYDFGSTTALVITLSDVVEAGREPSVRVVARNEAPAWPCDDCGQPATMICTQCMNEGLGFCCAAHAKEHSCGEELHLPVVNSPRMGVCGYTGGG